LRLFIRETEVDLAIEKLGGSYKRWLGKLLVVLRDFDLLTIFCRRLVKSVLIVGHLLYLLSYLIAHLYRYLVSALGYDTYSLVDIACLLPELRE